MQDPGPLRMSITLPALERDAVPSGNHDGDAAWSAWVEVRRLRPVLSTFMT